MDENKKPTEGGGVQKKNTVGNFVLLLFLLWVLNLADIFQTLYLKESGFLEQEANFFIDVFLREGRGPFIGAKVMALILITLILVRGWIRPMGMMFLGKEQTQEQVKISIIFLLSAGVVFYTIIVFFPFLAMLISGSFTG